MSFKIETIRDRDFSIIMTYSILYRELKFFPKANFSGFLESWGYDLELEKYLHPEE